MPLRMVNIARYVRFQLDDLRCWPSTDIPRCPQFGRYWEESGLCADDQISVVID